MRSFVVQYCGLNRVGCGKVVGKGSLLSTVVNHIHVAVNKRGVLPSRFTIFVHSFCAHNFNSSPLFMGELYLLSTPPITKTMFRKFTFNYY